MSTIDAYIDALRRLAGDHLTPDGERELLAHLEDAVAAQRAAGLTQEEAEVTALGQLGRPEVVASVFRREGRSWVQRLAEGPGGVVVAAQASWRLLLVATAGTALCGLLIGYAWPPMYQARVPLETVGHRDFGGSLGMAQALDQLRTEEGLHLSLGPSNAVEVLSANRDVAVADAQAEAARAIDLAPVLLRDTLYGDRPTYLVSAGLPEIEVLRPVVPAVLAGGLIGLITAVVVAVRRQRNRRIICDSVQSS